jgi:hypothetical protein
MVDDGGPRRSELEVLLDEGTRFVQALRPIWREVTRSLPRGKGRNYFAFAVGLVAVAVAGTYIVRRAKRERAEPEAPTGPATGV